MGNFIRIGRFFAAHYYYYFIGKKKRIRYKNQEVEK
jgi:hypothetical protein